MSNTRNFLEAIFNGEMPVTRRNRYTGEPESVYFNYDQNREELVESPVRYGRASSRFSEPMAFAQMTPAEPDYSRYGDDIPPALIERMNADRRFWNVMNRYTIPSEGGYSNDPTDLGGETNFGISRNTYPNEDIRHMTPERSHVLIYRDYWDYNNLYTLPDGLVGIALESAVNRGGPETIKDIHRSLGIEPPGDIIGPLTHQRLAESDIDQVRRDFAERMRNHYRNRVRQNPTQERFFRGWMNRVNRADH